MQDLAGKSVLVTGGSTGIGAAAARAFAEHGARVVIHYNRSEAAARQLVEAITAAGGTAHAVGADVTDPANVAKVVSEAVRHLGGLDILINNVGSLVRRTPAAEYDLAFLDEVLNINVRQLVMFVREAVPIMQQAGGGTIINTTSVAARHGGGPGAVLYAASKGFVSTATRGWARELAPHNIRVNAVSPGVILTPFHDRFTSPEQLAAMQAQVPAGRLGEPHECAGTFLYLASQEASGYVTGQIVEVNGGQYMP